MNHLIRIHRTHDFTGRPAPSVYELKVPDRATRASSEVVLDAIRDLGPRPTGTSGAYWYRDGRGTGWLEVVDLHGTARDELDQAVRILEIAERIGEPEPYRQPQLGLARLSAPRTTNPYTLMLTGAAMYGFAAWVVTKVLELGTDWPLVPTAMMWLLIITLAGVGTFLIVNGARRRRWWHRARAEARKMGGEMPEDLQILA